MGAYIILRIYKSDLESHGHNFISTFDTEVISEGFSRYGVDFVKSF